MASVLPKDLATAVAQGDFKSVELMLENGADISQRSKDGMSLLALASFWGYTEIVQALLKAGHDVNSVNHGTKWTPLHCAAFQGHGPVIMRLFQHQPDITMADMRGRTAVDFASAHDGIWPFFSSAGCQRTPKSKLEAMHIAQETFSSASGDRSYEFAETYGMERRDPNMEVAAITGDVLADADDNMYGRGSGGLTVYH